MSLENPITALQQPVSRTQLPKHSGRRREGMRDPEHIIFVLEVVEGMLPDIIPRRNIDNLLPGVIAASTLSSLAKSKGEKPIFPLNSSTVSQSPSTRPCRPFYEPNTSVRTKS